ncbi:MAG: peptidoglycan DD-metalloendopeptidase family protein [Gammaproteobacteria bacterium]|nr:peptidoglycan DD-metalloendopeptidase family protein [Gammaproteobacteria bacterium]MBQ0841105.1 peptidoglycan DD-metalloendopeptidase family protein [Gammaproteobacteria bacterium]
MAKRPAPLLALVVIVALSCTAPLFAKGEQAKLHTLSKEITQLQKKLRVTHTERDKSAARLRAIELQSATTRHSVLSLDKEIRLLGKELSKLYTQQQRLDEQRHRQAGQVAKELSAAYRLGREEPLKVLLNMENPEEIGRTLKYYEYIVAARSKILEDYQSTIRELDAVEQSLLGKQNALADKKTQLLAIQQTLSAEKKQRSALLKGSRQQIKSEKGHLAKLNLERLQLERIIQALQKHVQNLNIPDNKPFSQRRGKLPWPVKGRVGHSFGSARGSHLKWHGWLLNAREASPVKAIHHGRVVFSDYLRGQGLLVIVDHGDNYLSLYAHNQVLLKETGDWVHPGEAIAKVGNTGGLERSALYFEIRRKGKAVDPKRWLKPRA